ncbi:hypothetical protein AB4254_09220 [Vibrio breoganii]
MREIQLRNLGSNSHAVRTRLADEVRAHVRSIKALLVNTYGMKANKVTVQYPEHIETDNALSESFVITNKGNLKVITTPKELNLLLELHHRMKYEPADKVTNTHRSVFKKMMGDIVRNLNNNEAPIIKDCTEHTDDLSNMVQVEIEFDCGNTVKLNLSGCGHFNDKMRSLMTHAQSNSKFHDISEVPLQLGLQIASAKVKASDIHALMAGETIFLAHDEAIVCNRITVHSGQKIVENNNIGIKIHE